MKPVRIAGAPVTATKAAGAAGAATDTAAAAQAAELAKAARPKAGAAGAARTGAAAAGGAPKGSGKPRVEASAPDELTERARAMLPPPPQRPQSQTEGQKLRERHDAAVARDIEDIYQQKPGSLLGAATRPTREDFAGDLALQEEGYGGATWQRISDLAMGPKRTDALRYAIGSRVPELLGGGTPRGTEVLNLGGTPESEMVVYPRGVTRGIAVTARNPQEFMERVWQLREGFAQAKKDFSDARAAAQATRGERTASQSDVTRADEWARSRLQRVVDLREMLRNTGETEDTLRID